MPLTLSLIASAWAFTHKQPILRSILLWMWIVPFSIVDIAGPSLMPEDPTLRIVLDITLAIAGLFILSWGMAAVLLVGRRMIQNKAGRIRTSLYLIMSDSLPLLFPLLGTSLLRACFVFYRLVPALLLAMFIIGTRGLCPVSPTGAMSLLTCIPLYLLVPLLLPAIVYQIRTALYAPAIVLDNARYRSALRRSTDLVRGRFWHVTGVLAFLGLVLWVPALALSFFIDLLLTSVYPHMEPLSILLQNTILQSATLFFTLSLIAFYGRLRKRHAADMARALHQKSTAE